MTAEARLVAGCMTGTSIDGIDAALVRVEGRGLDMRAEFVRGVSGDLGEVGRGLRALADQQPMAAGEIVRLSREFALLHAAVVRQLLVSGGPAALVAVHGQTVFHAPPLSWQIFNGPVLARDLGVPVVHDLRAADLAAGGQGAPITPLADWVLFRSNQPTAIVNLGGFCNVTLVPTDAGPSARQIEQIRGFDVCACNHVLDRIAREVLDCPFDRDGARASAGTPDAGAAGELRGLLADQSASRRSLGTGDESGRWVEHWRGRLSPDDLAASACAGIGRAIAARLRGAGVALLAGGGARNGALAHAIEDEFAGAVETTSSRGVPIEFREAACMAVLGALCADGVPITLPQVTGVRAPAPVAGVWAGLHRPTA